MYMNPEVEGLHATSLCMASLVLAHNHGAFRTDNRPSIIRRSTIFTRSG
jgi:hypothetical protein